MSRRYLFFCAHGYAFDILRPLGDEIARRGDSVAWYLDEGCPDMLAEGDRRLHTVAEVKAYNPLAVFAPGNYVFDFFPGVKVCVKHGYAINKRGYNHDTHFKLRGWFDIMLTFGPESTGPFKALADRLGYFTTYETGWPKADSLIAARRRAESIRRERPAVFVASTFTKSITRLKELYPTIERLASTRDWDWHITRHPKLDDPEVDRLYSELAARRPNVTYYPATPGPDVMAATDVMLCDASSIILEYMLLDKPVVTFHNTTPGPHLIDVTDTADIERALERALTRPDDLLQAMRAYRDRQEAHTDGHNCARILAAVDDFIANSRPHLKPKPLNLFRRLQLRYRIFLKPLLKRK
ncbi:MAG: CDP-glycerol glycerophosphotransferase family protein [Muribaculaceae bacterium]